MGNPQIGDNSTLLVPITSTQDLPSDALGTIIVDFTVLAVSQVSGPRLLFPCNSLPIPSNAFAI